MPKKPSSQFSKVNKEEEEDYYAGEGGSVDSTSTDAEAEEECPSSTRYFFP